MNRSVVIAVGVAALVAAVILAWIEVRQEREFRRLIAVGDAALARDETSGAVEAFSGAVALKPDSMVAYLKRGDTYRRRREFAAALRDLQTAEVLDPTAPQPLELLGDATAAVGRHDLAAEHYGRYVALDDRAPRVLFKLAQAHYQAGNAAAAVEALRRAIAIDERLSEAHYLLGLCLRDGRRDAEAMRAFTRAVALDPALAAAREQLADLYASAGRRREGLEQLEALAALEPSRAERLVSLAQTYARLGRLDTAVGTLQRAAERFPDDANVSAALGRMWLAIAEQEDEPGALRKALAAVERAAAEPAAASETLALYGRVLFLSGRLEAAERALRLATTRFPVEAVAFRYLADVAGRLGHSETARQAVREYSALTAPAPRGLPAQ